MDKINSRNIVLNMLIRTLEEGLFSHLVLREVLNELDISAGPEAEDGYFLKERSFINRLYMGVLQKLVYIDLLIDHFSKTPVRKMKALIRNILREGVYQIVFMDSVPSRAAIDEAVKLTKKRGLTGLSGFVNGVLRNIDRGYASLELPEYAAFGVPEWIYDTVLSQYGRAEGQDFFRSIQEHDAETIVRFSAGGHAEESLRAQGCSFSCLDPELRAYAIKDFSSLTKLESFKKGWISIQDLGSMYICREALRAAADIEEALVLDVCAAPGGKSIFLASERPKWKIISRDISEAKKDLIDSNIKRLNIKNIESQVCDALVFTNELKEKADVLIADLPCSGLGVIRRKPDILYRLKSEDLQDLACLQRDILTTVKDYVKPEGILLYSTCTVNKGENEENTEWFLNKFPGEFKIETQKTYLPEKDGTDGFYVCVLRKRA